MSEKRKSIPKKIRFEVFKRDKFTCQYCGRMAPDVVLEVDHIKPVAKGGTNDIMNLVTSCYECNRGKRDVELSDDSVIKKQQEQLSVLAEKNEQLEMMLEWRTGLLDIERNAVSAVERYLKKKFNKQHLAFNDIGIRNITKMLRSYSVAEVFDAIDIATDQYFDGSPESAREVLRKISGICHNRKYGSSENIYWFNYLRKACFQKYGYADANDLKILCLYYMKNEEDFLTAKKMLYSDCELRWFMKHLREYLGYE